MPPIIPTLTGPVPGSPGTTDLQGEPVLLSTRVITLLFETEKDKVESTPFNGGLVGLNESYDVI